MSERSDISWCDSTFNPWVQWGAGQPRKRTSAENWRQPLRWNAQQFVQCAACGHRCELRKFHAVDGPADFTMCPACSGADWHGTRRRVFCASLADVFDNEVDPQWRADLFRLIADTPHLDWLLLTKRIGNVERMVMDSLRAMFLRTDREPPTWPWPHVWLGAAICNQAEADRDIPKLLTTPAARRFVSIEPWGQRCTVPELCLQIDGHHVAITAPDGFPQ